MSGLGLADFGWDGRWEADFAAAAGTDQVPGRVLSAAGGEYRVRTGDGEHRSTLAGRLRHTAATAAEIPTVGDWVVLTPADDGTARIERVLERRSKLSRRAPGKREDEQVVAANVDTVFIVMGLDGDYSLRRAERLLTLVWESGARPVVLLNKRDVCEDPDRRLAEVERVAPGVTVLVASCLEDDDVAGVQRCVGSRETAVLIGSSGAGKSTLINRLLGSTVQRTRDVREGDDRGRHTTTHRELFRMPEGGLLIDSPGIREVQLWSGVASLEQTFDDVLELASHCRFRDCVHEAESGCAVREAVEAGALSADRLESYRSLHKELAYLELRQNVSAQRTQKQKWRAIHKEMRRSGKHRRR